MFSKRPFFLKFFLYCFFFANSAGAQVSTDDSKNFSPDDPSYPVQLYYNAIGENAHIYNGYEYMTPDRNIKGSPYFTEALVPASLNYDDSYYQDIRILYDMVLDLVVINRLDQNFKISLINAKLNSFIIKNHEFIRIDKDSLHGVELVSGFYDRIYSGKSTILVKRKKYVQDVTEYTVSSLAYREEDKYFVKFDGKYVETGNKASVYKLFREKKTEIKSFLRKNKLKFKSDFEKTLIAATAYYDQLTS